MTREDWQALAHERQAWETRCQDFSDRQVLIHGDATPTNFLFPNGRAVALDLERLGHGDRLWDLSWVAGELKHAWGWRTADFGGSEAAIGHFFRMYLTAAEPDAALTQPPLSVSTPFTWPWRSCASPGTSISPMTTAGNWWPKPGAA